MKRIIRAALVSAMVSGGLAAAGPASAAIVVDVGIAPPAPQVEVIPAARPGYVWAPGYWDYRGQGHVWVPGRYIVERRGYHWVPDRWDQRGPRWHHERGHWER